jgi:RHS repeat-associated protein
VTARNGTPLAWTATGRLAATSDVAIAWDLADRPISITVAGVTRSFARFGGAVESDPATGAVLGVDLGVAQVSFASSARLYRHKDFRGNTSFVSDETGAVVAHYRYSAYGVDLVLGAGAADAQRFAGRLELSGGLVLMGARIYDPLVGRFLSQDPVFQALNAYSYTLGNPLDFWDPDGAEQSHAVLAAVASGAVAVGSAGALVLAGIAIANPAVPLGFALLGYFAAGTTFWGSFTLFLVSLEDLDPTDPSAGNSSNTIPEGFNLAGPGTYFPPAGDPPAPAPGPCAPTSLARLPSAGWLLVLLLPLQVGLAIFLLRARVRRIE